jgi:hypothetical protein
LNINRDKVGLDIVLPRESIEDLEANLEQFREIVGDIVVKDNEAALP